MTLSQLAASEDRLRAGGMPAMMLSQLAASEDCLRAWGNKKSGRRQISVRAMVDAMPSVVSADLSDPFALSELYKDSGDNDRPLIAVAFLRGPSAML